MAKTKALKTNSGSASKQHAPRPVVYVGPNLPGGSLSAFTVFKNGLPAHVQQLQEQTPELQALFVPVNELPTARQRLARSGPEAKAMQTVRKKFNL